MNICSHVSRYDLGVALLGLKYFPTLLKSEAFISLYKASKTERATDPALLQNAFNL